MWGGFWCYYLFWFGIDSYGLVGVSDWFFCRSLIECLLGDLMKVMCLFCGGCRMVMFVLCSWV